MKAAPRKNIVRPPGSAVNLPKHLPTSRHPSIKVNKRPIPYVQLKPGSLKNKNGQSSVVAQTRPHSSLAKFQSLAAPSTENCFKPQAATADLFKPGPTSSVGPLPMGEKTP